MASESGCPICGKPVGRARAAAGAAVAGAGSTKAGADPFPFCSARCQLIDLGRWLGEEYRVADRETVVWPAADVEAADDDGRRG